jgi:alkanesulfonate monooxygenase SsuD/methylene tetrahydromethanopterin reductase-like flavin-dependent oxidoreductase (luciferase family)
MTSPNFTPLSLVKKQFGMYTDALAAAGHNSDGFSRPLMQQVYVANDDKDAFETPRPFVEWNEALKKRLLPGADGSAVAAGYEIWERMTRNIESLSYEDRWTEGSLFATPEKLGERVNELRVEAGVTELICWFNFGGMPDKMVRHSMQVFAEEVIPKLSKAEH